MPRPPSASFQDPTTELSNRAHFEVLYDFAFQLADRGVPITIVYLEIDGLPDLRTPDGQAVDGRVGALARLLMQTTRSMDVTAHLEGGRFVLLLADCNLHGGLVCADRVRAEAANSPDLAGFTVSAGIASHEKGMTRKEDLLEIAEETLRVALSSGGDRVAVPADLNLHR